MKTFNVNRVAIILALIISAAACKKDKNTGSDFVGNYVIVNASLSEALTVPTVEMGNLPLPVGTAITPLIQSALLSAVTCSSPDKSYVELREDFSLYLSCETANPLNAGTWEEVSGTSIKLNLNSTAVPSSPVGLVLTVTDVVKNGTDLTGVTSVPLPKAMIAGLLAAMQVPLTLAATAPDLFIAKFSIKFTQK